MVIVVHSSRTATGDTRVDVVYSPHGTRAEPGWPGARSITLTRAEALELRRQLDVALSGALTLAPKDGITE